MVYIYLTPRNLQTQPHSFHHNYISLGSS